MSAFPIAINKYFKKYTILTCLELYTPLGSCSAGLFGF